MANALLVAVLSERFPKKRHDAAEHAADGPGNPVPHGGSPLGLEARRIGGRQRGREEEGERDEGGDDHDGPAHRPERFAPLLLAEQ